MSPPYICSGAKDRGRTGDPSFFRAVLYQLSYLGLPSTQVIVPYYGGRRQTSFQGRRAMSK